MITRVLSCVALMSVIALAGCARGPANDVADPALERETGTPAIVVTPSTSSTTTVAAGDDASATTSPNEPVTTQPDASASTTSTTTSTTIPTASEPEPLKLLVDVRDGAGDHDLTGRTPAYADARLLAIQANERDVAAVVRFDATVPATLTEGDVQGVGVDFFVESTNPRLSDAQYFAVGNADGWYAYLSVGEGDPQPLPGSFVIDGDTMTFRTSWDALDLPDGSLRVSSFVDFSRGATPVNVVGEDHVPNSGTADVPR